MNAWSRIAVTAAIALTVTSQVGAVPSSDVMGQVQDAAGMPIVGAKLTFTHTADDKNTYSVTSDKKGRFAYSGLVYAPPGTWKMTIEASGFAPSKVQLLSKTQSEVVANEESSLKHDGSPFVFPLKAFGNARLTVTMIPADQVPKTAAAPGAPSPGSAPVVADDPLAQAAAKVQAGDLTGAVPFYEKAIAAKPGDADVHLEFAKVLLKLEEVGKAEANAKRAIEIAPTKRGAHRVLANLYAEQGDYARAYGEMKQEQQLAPDDPALLGPVARLADLAGKPAEAIVANEALVAVQPNNANAWAALGDLYSRAGQSEKSAAAFRKVTELDPTNAYQTFFNLGAVVLNQPNPSQAEIRKAIDAFRRSVELKPDYGPASKELAFALVNLGEFDQARSVIDRYLAIDGASADARELKDLVSGLPPPKTK